MMNAYSPDLSMLFDSPSNKRLTALCFIVGVGLAILLSACSSGGAAPATELSLESPTPEIQYIIVTATPQPSPTASPTISPTPEASPPASATRTPAPVATAGSATVTAVPADAPAIPGRFDVYLGEPDDNNRQVLRWVDTDSGESITEILIVTDDGQAVRGGDTVYYLAPGTRQPMQANTAGAVQTLEFAAPPPSSTDYELLPAANGAYLAWLVVEDLTFRILVADAQGDVVTTAAEGAMAEGESISLVRLANDGQRVFYERRPDGITYQSIFRERYALFLADLVTGRALRLPGEPACGEVFVCDAHISPDGSVLVRTLPPSVSSAPIIVTNLDSNSVILQQAPTDVPSGAAYNVGYPLFTPGGELVYVLAFGAPGLESFRLMRSNLSNGQQQIVANLGSERHRPLGWAGDGVTLLTTREPAFYDTWQINIETGALRQIAGMRWLGTITQAPTESAAP
ncbi:MAG: hypothetical protein GYB68_03435 [Chloroflexi bacterium]|nr:hypothetical protein [Chloroflexota bacterium]